VPVGDLKLPIDDYGQTLEEQGTVSMARGILIGRCMASYGFHYDPAADRAEQERFKHNAIIDNGLYGNIRRYGVTTATIASRIGFHMPSTVDQPASPRRPTNGLGDLPETGEKLLVGSGAGKVNGKDVPPGGCVGQADAQLAGTAEISRAELVAKIRADSYQASLADPKVKTAFAAWARCMAKRGYRYPDPRRSGTDFDIGVPEVTPAEIAAATTDVACKQAVDLVDIWSTFEINYQREQIRIHAPELQEIALQARLQVSRAQVVLGS